MKSGEDSILKNRYYLVTKDEKPYAYFSVKKDFYCEGFLIEEKTSLVGYFNAYKSFDVHIIDCCNDRNYFNGFAIVPKKSDDSFAVNGEIFSEDYHLYRANLDEYCNHHLGEEIVGEIEIKKLTDEEVIQDVNYLIRSSLRKLTGIDKDYYEMLKRHRYGNLKEALSGLKSLSEIGIDSEIPASVIKDLEFYLKSLNPIKMDSSCGNNNRKSQNASWKKVKRKTAKKSK